MKAVALMVLGETNQQDYCACGSQFPYVVSGTVILRIFFI